MATPAHDFDEDGVCTRCGLDGAEWVWWKRDTYEGKANPDAKMPLCVQINRGGVDTHGSLKNITHDS